MPRPSASSGGDDNRSRPGGSSRRDASRDGPGSTPDSVADAEIRSYIERAATRAPAFERLPALSAFQQRMAQYPQLSPNAQAELVADYQAGIAARPDTKKRGRGGAAAQRRAQAKVRRGDWAIEHLIGSSFRLVWLICRENAESRYGRERAGQLLPDLVGEANIALTEAAQSFNPNRGPSFSTYAARVVRDRVRAVLTKEGTIRLAPSWARLKRIASVRIPQLTSELGRTPTDAEIKAELIALCLEWAENKLTPAQKVLSDEERLELKMAKLRKQGMLGAIENFADLLVVSQTVDSFDRPVGEDGSSMLGELVVRDDGDYPGAYSPGGFDNVELGELRESLMEALSALSERDREIILYRYGFVDGENWVYGKIAERYGVTAERIRQIEHQVLAKLRAPHGMHSKLAAFLPSQFEDDEDDDDTQGGAAPVRLGPRPGRGSGGAAVG